MTIVNGNVKKMVLSSLFALIVLGISGCHRGEDGFDDRTLAQRPHVETMTPDSRKDIFKSGN